MRPDSKGLKQMQTTCFNSAMSLSISRGTWLFSSTLVNFPPLQGPLSLSQGKPHSAPQISYYVLKDSLCHSFLFPSETLSLEHCLISFAVLP